MKLIEGFSLSMFIVMLLAGCQQNPLVGRWEAIEIIGDHRIAGLGLEFEPDGRLHFAQLSSNGKCFVSLEKYEVQDSTVSLYVDGAHWIESRRFEINESINGMTLTFDTYDTRFVLLQREEPFESSRRPREADIRRTPRSIEQEGLADVRIHFDSWSDLRVWSADGEVAGEMTKQAFVAWLKSHPPTANGRTRLAYVLIGKIVDVPDTTLDELESLLRRHGYDAIGFYKARSLMPWSGFDVIRERPPVSPNDSDSAEPETKESSQTTNP